MATIDLDELLKEMSPEFPCGEDLEEDHGLYQTFQAMEKAARPKPPPEFEPDKAEEPPDWRQTQANALALLARTKDLRPAIYLSKALLNTQGFPGFSEGLRLIRGLLENYWETLYPQLDPEDGNDPTLRINTLISLCDREFMLNPIREIPLVSLPVLGSFSPRDIDIASGKLALPVGSEDQAVDLSSINTAFMECDLESLQATAQGVRASIADISAIEAYVTDQVGVATAPNFSDLVRELKDIDNILAERLTQRGANEPAPAQAEEAANELGTVTPAEPTAVRSGEIAGRDDVIQTLDRLCEYYKRYEPSSPVPLLLMRAKRLVSLNFMEILQDLAPNGIPQVEAIRGTGRETSSE